jgi:putative heme-binding domain-containing protein
VLQIDINEPALVAFKLSMNTTRIAELKGVKMDDGPRTFATWHTAEDNRPRAFPLRRFLMPFAKPADAKAAEPVVAKLEGDWLAGRRLYFGKAQCATCHTTGGQGGRVGPDLSNLSFRDRASVERDIREPGAALNPDHLTYHITLKNGAELAAVMLTEDKEKFRIGEANGAVRDLPRAEVREVKALPVSLMPPGLLEALTPAEQNDLIKFLLSPAPLEPAPIDAPNPPAARKRAEFEAVLEKSKQSAVDSGQSSPLRILLVSAKKDHGPGEHDYPLFQKRWSALLGLAGGVEVATAQDWPTVEQLAATDVAVFYSNNPAWNPDRKAELDAFLQRGGGAVFIHWAIEGREFAPELADCIGLASNSKALKYRHGALTMNFPNADHPITRGFKATDFIDETYWQAVGDPKRITLLGDVVEDGEPRPQLWAREHGKGRVFVSIPGHYTWTFDDPLHRVLLLRGICWTARQPIDRLSELATIGSRMEW